MPTTLFHGVEPVKSLDLRFFTRAMQAVEVNSDYVWQLQDAMLPKFLTPPITVIPPADIRTPSPMNSPRNSQENSPRASPSDSHDSAATPKEFQYPESLTGAAESESIRANNEEDTEQQPGPSTRSNQNS